MKTRNDSTLKPRYLFLGVMVLFVIVAIIPHAFAQTYTDADNPHGPLQMLGWTAGMVAAGVATGVGVWTAVKRR